MSRSLRTASATASMRTSTLLQYALVSEEGGGGDGGYTEKRVRGDIGLTYRLTLAYIGFTGGEVSATISTRESTLLQYVLVSEEGG